MATMSDDTNDTYDNNPKIPGKNGKKRIRCINFTSQEKNILIHIIEKYPDIIECKKTDKISVQQRDSVWEGVTREFNDIFLNETVRTTKQLRMCYDNLKRRIRKENSTNEPTSNRPKTEISELLRSQYTDPSDDSNSSTRLQGSSLQTVNSSFQDSACEDMPEFQSEPYLPGICENQEPQEVSSEPPKKKPGLMKLRKTLLNKQIECIEFDMEMKARKYEMELQVEQAKLEYYKKKCALLEKHSAATSNISDDDFKHV